MSPYIGDKLAPLFDDEPVEFAMERLAEEGAEDFQKWVQRNTPVEFGTLRASWYLTPGIWMPSAGAPGAQHPGTRSRVHWLRTEVDYAPHVEWGTGIYGPSGSPYPIEPRDPGGVLTWIDAATGRRIFATRVSHPGSPGQHMMAIGAAMAEHNFPVIAAPILREWKLAQEALVR